METLPKIPAGMQEDNWTHAVLRKGFVRRGYIAEKPGLYPAVRFVYTPLLPEQVDEMEYAIATLKANQQKQATAKVAAALLPRLKSWSIEEPISELNLRSLGDELLSRLRQIMCQRLPSDIDPLWEEETNDFKSVDELLGESSELSA